MFRTQSDSGYRDSSMRPMIHYVTEEEHKGIMKLFKQVGLNPEFLWKEKHIIISEREVRKRGGLDDVATDWLI